MAAPTFTRYDGLAFLAPSIDVEVTWGGGDIVGLLAKIGGTTPFVIVDPDGEAVPLALIGSVNVAEEHDAMALAISGTDLLGAGVATGTVMVRIGSDGSFINGGEVIVFDAADLAFDVLETGPLFVDPSISVTLTNPDDTTALQCMVGAAPAEAPLPANDQEVYNDFGGGPVYINLSKQFADAGASEALGVTVATPGDLGMVTVLATVPPPPEPPSGSNLAGGSGLGIGRRIRRLLIGG